MNDPRSSIAALPRISQRSVWAVQLTSLMRLPRLRLHLCSLYSLYWATATATPRLLKCKLLRRRHCVLEGLQAGTAASGLFETSPKLTEPHLRRRCSFQLLCPLALPTFDLLGGFHSIWFGSSIFAALHGLRRGSAPRCAATGYPGSSEKSLQLQHWVAYTHLFRPSKLKVNLQT